MSTQEKFLVAEDSHACREYNEVTRRRFMGMTGGLGVMAAVGAPAWLPRVAFAGDHDSTRDALVVIFLRGGCDGLTLCAPFGEGTNYYSKRPTLAIPRPDSSDPNKGVDLDGFFCLPKAMQALYEPYNAGYLAVVHAIGSANWSRSHFDAQAFMEKGKPQDPTLFTGWLGRHLLGTPPIKTDALLRAVSLSFGLPQTLVGGPKTTPVPDLSRFGITGSSTTRPARLASLDTMYDAYIDPLKTIANNTQATIAMLAAINFTGYQPAGGAVYPTGSFGTALRSTAALLKAQVGVEAVQIDLGGWDTHSSQGPLTGGMATLMATLANGVGAFFKDVYTSLQDVTVVVMSEFGRRVAENGSLGTDHGHGNCMFVMGPKINGGRVLTQWPGLATLYQGLDLQVTWDFRDILAEIVQNRLGNPALANVFPGYTPVFRGITKP